MEKYNRDNMRHAIVGLFREYPLLKDKAIIIGGAAAILRLEKAQEAGNIRPTIDIDLVAEHDIDVEKVKEKASGYNDVFDIDGVAVPVVGPVGLLATKLSRSGEKGREYYRGQDLADVIKVWLAEPDTVVERWTRLRDMPGVKEAVDEFKDLLSDDYSIGTLAVLSEMHLDAGDMDYILLKARLDDLLSKLK